MHAFAARGEASPEPFRAGGNFSRRKHYDKTGTALSSDLDIENRINAGERERYGLPPLGIVLRAIDETHLLERELVPRPIGIGDTHPALGFAEWSEQLFDGLYAATGKQSEQ